MYNRLLTNVRAASWRLRHRKEYFQAPLVPYYCYQHLSLGRVGGGSASNSMASELGTIIVILLLLALVLVVVVTTTFLCMCIASRCSCCHFGSSLELGQSQPYT